MDGSGIPPGLLLERYPSGSSEDDGMNKDLLMAQNFLTPGILLGHGSSSGHHEGSNDIYNFTHGIASSSWSNSGLFNASGNLHTMLKLNKSNKYEETEYPDFSQIQIVRVIFICLFVAESVIGVLGNFFVCLTVYRNKSMHSPVNYYIVNLGICDFLVGAVVLPVKLFELTADAEMNMMTDFWCTTVRFLETIVVFASVFTLVAICFERYNAVVYPVQSRINMTNLRIRRVLSIVWIIPCIVAAPNLYPATAVSDTLYSIHGQFTRVTCFDGFSDTFRFGYFMSLFIFMYLVPLLFIAVTCFSIACVLLKEIPIQPRRDPRALTLEQGRRKVAKMVIVVVFSFVLLWSPYFLVTAVTQLQTKNFLHDGQYFFTMLLINLLAFTNSCVNPFVYFAMSARFRKGFLCILHSCRNCSRRNRFSPENSQSSLRHGSHNRTINGMMSLHTHPSRRHIATANGRNPKRTDISLNNSKAIVGGGGVGGRGPCRNGSGSNGGAGCSSPRILSSSSTSPNPVTSNNFSTAGNIKVRAMYNNHNGHEMPIQRCSSNNNPRTIVLQINHCRSPTCCKHFVPLMTDENGRIVSPDKLEDSKFPWDESCNL